MAFLLNIETSSPVCSVALAKDGKIIASREDFDGKSHASLLTVFIDEVLKESGTDIQSLDAISVSKGPGSYTGLRIGVSAVKGICFGIQKPLIAISTLQALANGILMKNLNTTNASLLCPLIDARRMEVYSAIFDNNLVQQRDIKAEIIDENSFSNILEKKPILLFGDGSEKCKEKIRHKNAIFIDNIISSAEYMVSLSEDAYKLKQFEDVAYFEPFYLKHFVATIPKRKVF